MFDVSVDFYAAHMLTITIFFYWILLSMPVSDWGYWGSVLACSVSYWLFFIWICWCSIFYLFILFLSIFVCLFYVLFLLQTHLSSSSYPLPISSSEPTPNSVLLAVKMMFKQIVSHAKSGVKLKAFEGKFLVRRQRSVSWRSRRRKC